MPSDLKRVDREVRHCKNLEQDGVMVEILGDNLTLLKGYLKGPEDTPYAGT